MLRSSFCRKVAYEPGRTPTGEFLSRRAHAVKGGVNQVLWAEQFWNGHPRKLDREMLEVCPSAKIGPLEISRYTVCRSGLCQCRPPWSTKFICVSSPKIDLGSSKVPKFSGGVAPRPPLVASAFPYCRRLKAGRSLGTRLANVVCPCCSLA